MQGLLRKIIKRNKQFAIRTLLIITRYSGWNSFILHVYGRELTNQNLNIF